MASDVYGIIKNIMGVNMSIAPVNNGEKLFLKKI